MRIRGCVALVTGGSSGLGAAAALHLVAHGAQVVVLDLRTPDAKTKTSDVTYCEGSVTSSADISTAIELAASHGDLRIVVNCAGVGSNERIASLAGDGSVMSADIDAFRRVIDINLVGTFDVMRLAAASVPAPREAEEIAGVFVNTASIAAFEGQVGQAAYSASKAAVVAMTFTAARDLAPLGIRVDAIAPGLMETPLFATVRRDIRDGLVESVVWPRRSGAPEEFAHLVGHLIENDYINGETVRLDAGARLPYRASTRHR